MFLFLVAGDIALLFCCCYCYYCCIILVKCTLLSCSVYLVVKITNMETDLNKKIEIEFSFTSTNDKLSNDHSTQVISNFRHMRTEYDHGKTNSHTVATKWCGETENCNIESKGNSEDSVSDSHTKTSQVGFDATKRLYEAPSCSKNCDKDYSNENGKVNCDNSVGLPLDCVLQSEADLTYYNCCINSNKQSGNDNYYRELDNENIEIIDDIPASVFLSNINPVMSSAMSCVRPSHKLYQDEHCPPTHNNHFNAVQTQENNICSTNGSNIDSAERSKMKNQDVLVSLNSATNHISSSSASCQVFSVYDECSEYNEVSSLCLYSKLCYLLFFRKKNN